MKTLKEVNIEQVWDHFIQHHDIQSRNTLLEHYLPNVKYTAERLNARLPQNVELDDLYSVGIVGLIDAINKFDPSRNVKFETYCVRRIQGEIIDDIRKKDRVPRLVRARKLTKALSLEHLLFVWSQPGLTLGGGMNGQLKGRLSISKAD